MNNLPDDTIGEIYSFFPTTILYSLNKRLFLE